MCYGQITDLINQKTINQMRPAILSNLWRGASNKNFMALQVIIAQKLQWFILLLGQVAQNIVANYIFYELQNTTQKRCSKVVFHVIQLTITWLIFGDYQNVFHSNNVFCWANFLRGFRNKFLLASPKLPL
jgi:uncharacterized protein YukE